MGIHLFHKWTKWQEPASSKFSNGFGSSGVGMFQRKDCRVCGKTKARQVRAR